MALLCRLQQDVFETGAGPISGIAGDAQFLGHRVRCFETDSADVFREQVRIASDRFNRFCAVCLMNPYRTAGAQSM